MSLVNQRKPKPNWFVLYRHNNTNYWEAIAEGQMEGFLEKLMKQGVNLAIVMISQGLMVYWAFPSFHNDLKMVRLSTLYEEIEGSNKKSNYTPVDVPTKSREISYYGYISPDGRYFQCNYGDHSTLARQIVGELENIKNPTKYLEDKNWAVIYKDPINNKPYSIFLSYNHKLTNEQVKVINSLPIKLEKINEYL